MLVTFIFKAPNDEATLEGEDNTEESTVLEEVDGSVLGDDDDDDSEGGRVEWL